MASYQLHCALRDAGCESTMLVQHRVTADPDVIRVPTRPILNAFRLVQRSLPRLRPSRRHQLFNDDREPGIRTRALFERPLGSVDVIYLHWVARLLSSRLTEEVARYYGCPVISIPLDLEPVTGGCHFAAGCTRFEEQCGCCPILGGHDEHDRSRTVWKQKQVHLTPLPLTFVSGSAWMTEMIRRSSLFHSHPIVEIGLPIDTALFSPEGRDVARRRWDLPQDRKIIFIGAQKLDDPRKGMRELLLALDQLAITLHERSANRHEDPLLMIVGSSPGIFGSHLPFTARFIDRIVDRRELAAAYRCADVYVCPSIDDAGPMMIPEAMLCGTPVVAFEMGGAPDLIRNGVTGYMARLGEPGDLARGMYEILYESAGGMGQRARVAAHDRHHPGYVTDRHVALCQQLISHLA